MLDGFLFGLKIAPLILAFVYMFVDRIGLAIIGVALALFDLAWFGGFISKAYQFFSQVSGAWWIGLVLSLGGLLTVALGISTLYSRLFCHKRRSWLC